MADTGLFSKIYNPDVLNCLANLSNEEGQHLIGQSAKPLL